MSQMLSRAEIATLFDQQVSYTRVIEVLTEHRDDIMISLGFDVDEVSNDEIVDEYNVSDEFITEIQRAIVDYLYEPHAIIAALDEVKEYGF